MSIRKRYKYYPQMEQYDELVSRFTPYLMFMSKGNYLSEVVNTDSNGFRLSGNHGGLRMDTLDKTGKINIFTGGSTAFGVGATSDGCTISALLSHKTRSRWANFAGRAHVSTQEYISFAYHRDLIPEAIDNIIIFSGINDLYLYFASKYFNMQMGSSFMASDFMHKMHHDTRLRAVIIRPIVNKILKVIYGEYDFELISNRDAVNLLLNKISIGSIENDLADYSIIGSHNPEPSEVINVLRRNISNWKVMANYYNAKVTYILQPFANWLPNRSLTDNERHVFDILDDTASETWVTTLKSINGLHGWYSRELDKLCKELNVNFFDSNIEFDKKLSQDVFVDRVHLTDFGNKIVSDFIVEKVWK